MFEWFVDGRDSYHPAFDRVGSCVPANTYHYDDDNDDVTPDVALPGCTALPNADTDGDGTPQHAELGCAPYPRP